MGVGAASVGAGTVGVGAATVGLGVDDGAGLDIGVGGGASVGVGVEVAPPPQATNTNMATRVMPVAMFLYRGIPWSIDLSPKECPFKLPMFILKY